MSVFPKVCISMVALTAAVTPATAASDGLPVGNVDAGPGGVVSRTGDMRYHALPAGSNTVALAVRTSDGQVPRHRSLRGRYTVPVVALDGTPGGLSADGRTLVLIKPRQGFPRATTTFAVLDTQRMRRPDIVRLRGDFSYDAMSPDGGLVYLIQYTSRRDPTRYAVRGYDTRKGRLLPDPIIDPRAFGEGEMRGYPITRATSPNGQWAYTLYDGTGGHPFVHALNTREMTAACIDLHGLAGRKDLAALGLGVSADGARINVLDSRHRTLAVIDAKTFRVSTPGSTGGDRGGLPVALWPAVATVVLGAGALVLMRTRRRGAVAPT